MAVVHIDTFDHYDTATAPRKGWQFVVGPQSAISIASGEGRNGTNALYIDVGVFGNNNTTYALLGGLSPSGATFVLQAAFRCNALPTGSLPVLYVRDGSTTQFVVVLTSSGSIEVRQGNGAAVTGTLLGSTAASTITATIQHYLELEVAISNASGTVDLKVDGTSVISLSGVDSQVSASAAWTGIVFGCLTAIATSGLEFYLDDLIVMDGSGASHNTLMGDQRGAARLPTGAGASADWTPTSGDNYANVDETPPDGATSQVSSNLVGDTDLHAHAALSLTGTVSAVQHDLYAKADQAGVRSLVSTVRIGGTTYEHPTPQVLGSDWQFHRFVWLTNPATATAWDDSDLDGSYAQFGYRVAA